MTMPLDVSILSDWLGPEGAIAGLERSNLTNAELMVLARERGLQVDSKSARRMLAIELVMSPLRRIDKPAEFLMRMSTDELKRYFLDRLVSNAELLKILAELGIAPKGKLRIKLSDYAAREITELGMFQRVAGGNTHK